MRSQTCIFTAGGPLGGHGVPLHWSVVDGQQVVVGCGAPYAGVLVQQRGGIQADVVAGCGQTLQVGMGMGGVNIFFLSCILVEFFLFFGKIISLLKKKKYSDFCDGLSSWRWQLTQIRCLLSIRSMSSLILGYLSSVSGLWPAESSASMSGLSLPLRPFFRNVWKYIRVHQIGGSFTFNKLVDNTQLIAGKYPTFFMNHIKKKILGNIFGVRSFFFHETVFFAPLQYATLLEISCFCFF